MNIDNERAAFEKWVRRETEFDLERQTNGEYAFSGASDAYAGWLARAQSDKALAVPDTYTPTDSDVRAWMERNDIPDSYVDQWRTAIDDARSMHMLAAAPEVCRG